jgi:hypothetical protein
MVRIFGARHPQYLFDLGENFFSVGKYCYTNSTFSQKKYGVQEFMDYSRESILSLSNSEFIEELLKNMGSASDGVR